MKAWALGQIARIRDFDDPTYDPFTAMGTLGGEDRIADFYPELARLRAAGPVFEGDLRQHFGLYGDLTMASLRHVAVLGHREVNTVLRDPATFSNAIYNHNLGVFFGRSVTTMDQPEHERYRRLFQRAFNPKMVQRWADILIPRTITRLIDDFAPSGHADLVSEFTLHFPFHFIHELLGLPLEDREIFQKLAFGQIGIIFDTEHGTDAIEKLKSYLTEIVADRRRAPIEGDFISAIATSEVDGERLPEDVVIAFFRQLMNAAGDTSYHGSSTILAGLLTHPDQLAAVQADRLLVNSAIEEGLRWNAPVPVISRTTLREVELAGVRINPGDHIAVVLAAANRDPAAFPDPDFFDISRGTQLNLAFGSGTHLCMGRHLARLEMGIAINMLLDRFPRLRLDPDHPAPEVRGFSLRKPSAVHVRFD